jgi:hypothetical protein
MNLDELFNQNNRSHGYGHEHHYEKRYNYPSHHSDNQHGYLKQQLINKLQLNPKLKMLLMVAAILILVVVVATIIILYPILMKLIGYVGENGIQGLINVVWSGSK